MGHLCIGCRQKHGLQTKALGEFEVSIKGAAEAEVGEGLVEAKGSVSFTIMEDQDTMWGTVWI